jgi:uncharacterized spore protein YtfJ
MPETSVEDALSKLEAVKDVMGVRRVFGEAYQLDDAKIIPVASVRGAGGAGGSTGGGEETPEGAPPGAGLGFGMDARPVGVLVVKDGSVDWRPTVDATRIALNGQRIAFAAMATFGALMVWRNVSGQRRGARSARRLKAFRFPGGGGTAGRVSPFRRRRRRGRPQPLEIVHSVRQGPSDLRRLIGAELRSHSRT